MESEQVKGEKDQAVRRAQIEARARNIQRYVRCTECGSQSIEDSQADIAVLLRKFIRDELKAGKSDKEVYFKLRDVYGESVLYAPRFDMQTAALWLFPVLATGFFFGISRYRRHRDRSNLDHLADKLLSGVPLTQIERHAVKAVLKPPKRRGWF
eukprot:c22372_g1_i1 orf=481-942(+)